MVAKYARDLFLLLISALLFPVLCVPLVLKHALAYAVFALSGGEHATDSQRDTLYPTSVDFLEACLAFFQITFAALINAAIVLPSVRTCIDLEAVFDEYKARLLPASFATSSSMYASSLGLNGVLAALAGILSLLLFRGKSSKLISYAIFIYVL